MLKSLSLTLVASALVLATAASSPASAHGGNRTHLQPHPLGAAAQDGAIVLHRAALAGAMEIHPDRALHHRGAGA